MGDFVDPQQILGARTSFCGMQTSLTTAPLTGFEDVGSTKQKRGHHLARAGFLSSRSHGTAGFILQIKTAIAHAVAVFWFVGDISKKSKGRPFHRSPRELERISNSGIPLMGSGRSPKPPERSEAKWENNINAPRGKCHLRVAVSAIIVGTGVLDGPISELHVPFRYLKTKPILLPNIKNAAIGGIIKYS